MIPAQNTKATIVVLPQSVGTTEVNGTVDTLGWDYCTINFIADTAAASSVPTTMSLAEGDTTSAYTAITTFEGGDTTDGFTIPAPQTATGDIVKYHVDLRQRKRYLQVGWASTTARLSAVTAELSRGKINPNTDAEANCAEIVYG